MRTNTMKKAGYAAAGLVAGVALATTVAAQAATSPTPSTTGSTTASADPHPGDNGADGVPEANEVHGGHGGGGGDLSQSGTVTAVGSSTVTIKTTKGTTAYAVTSTSDIDKNGEATLASLKPGDAVRFSVMSSSATTIDKLHAGDEAKDRPAGGPQGPAGPPPTQG